MKRRILSTLAAISLLLCLAEGPWWVQSYWYLDDVIRKWINSDVVSNYSTFGDLCIARTLNSNRIAPTGRSILEI